MRRLCRLRLNNRAEKRRLDICKKRKDRERNYEIKRLYYAVREWDENKTKRQRENKSQ